MTDRQGNPIKLYYSEREAYDKAEKIARIEGMDSPFADLEKYELANTLLDALERLGRLRQSLEVE